MIRKLYYKIPHNIRYELDAAIGRNKSMWKKLRRERLSMYDKNDCIFVHVPKTAGISISTALFGEYPPGHFNMASYQKIFPPETLSDYFKFCFVRNPWDRLLSAYEFLASGGLSEEDRIWKKEVLSSYPSFESFVKGYIDERTIWEKDGLRPQYYYVTLPGKDELEVDFVGRFENLQNDFSRVANLLGKDVKLPHKNSTEHNKYENYYDKEMKKKVEALYQKDVKFFEYTY